MGSGLFLYDALAGLHPAMPHHRHLTRRSCLRAVPGLRADSLTGGIRYYDAQVDDARFSLVLARTAGLPAPCVSARRVSSAFSTRATGCRGKGARPGVGARVRGAGAARL